MSSLFYDIIIFPVVWFFLGGGIKSLKSILPKIKLQL